MILGETVIVFGRTLCDPFSISRRKRNYGVRAVRVRMRVALGLPAENRIQNSVSVFSRPSGLSERVRLPARNLPSKWPGTDSETPEFCPSMSQSHVAHRHFVALRCAAEFRIDKLSCRTRGTCNAEYLRYALFCHH